MNYLITGGTGTFGHECTRQLLALKDTDRLVIFSRDEFKQQEMAERFTDSRIRFFIGDVRDKERLLRAFHGIQVVFHAAALKQVPSCEYNPREAVLTNIFGAMNVIEAAIDCGVERVMALSTDKAVAPVNLYGATKLCAEKLFVRANGYASGTATRFSVVRYGNVIGSRGSLFAKTSTGVEFRLTHPEMTRFATSPEQAVRFVLDCLHIMQGGEIFVPKLSAFRVVDAMRQMTATGNIEITGMRPGEKIHETLIGPDEQGVREYDHFFIIEPLNPSWTYKRLYIGSSFSRDKCNWYTSKDLLSPDALRLVGDPNV